MTTHLAVRTRVRRLPDGLVLALGSGVAVLALGGTAPVTAPGERVLATASLGDDDGGVALFDVAGLVPGQAVTRCLQVVHPGAAEAGDVLVTARALTGTLAAHLRMRIDVGTGGSFAGCAGFAGQPVWRGSLADLAAPVSPLGWPAGWSPSGVDQRTYRVTAQVDDTAAGRGATADLVWTLVPHPATSQPSTPAPATSGISGLALPPTLRPPLWATQPARPHLGPTVEREPSGPGTTGAVAAPAQTSSGGAAVVRGRHATSGRGGALTAAALARAAAGPGAISLLLVVLMLLFLLLQRRLDERDPKLVHAPVRPEPALEYEDPS